MANENLIDKETLQLDETSSELLGLIEELKKQNNYLGRKFKEQKRKYSELHQTIADKKDLSTISKDIRKNHMDLYHSIAELQALENKFANLAKQEDLCSIVGSVKQIPIKTLIVTRLTVENHMYNTHGIG